jgi:hypothetical protein
LEEKTLTPAIVAIISALLGGGILGFIQFIISRRDNKKETYASLQQAIKENHNQMIRLEAKIDKREALHTRTNILRFNDELLANMDHSHETFLDILDQVQVYKEYCDDHPHFPNGRTVQATENIKHVYEKLFDQKVFTERLPKA